MDEYAAFWWGRGAAPASPPPRNPNRDVPSNVNTAQPSWLERTERAARACRTWVALAGDLVGLLFRLLVFGATAWCMWTGMAVVGEARSALQTEEGARYAGRAVDAFLSALSAPALAALGAGAAALLATVVYVLCGDFGRPRQPAPAAAPPAQPGEPPWGPAWNWPGNSWGGPGPGWGPPQQPLGVADHRLPALPGAAGGALELEDNPAALARGPPRRRPLRPHHTVFLVALFSVAAGPCGAGGTLLRQQEEPGAGAGLLNATKRNGAPPAEGTWDLPATPALRCGAWVLLHAAAGGVGLPGVPALVADCGYWAALEFFAEGVLAGRRSAATGAAPDGEQGLPLTRRLAWKQELQAARALVLLDAGVDEVGEGVATSYSGKRALLVLHRRNRALTPTEEFGLGKRATRGPALRGSQGRAGERRRRSRRTTTPPLVSPGALLERS